MRTQTGRGAKPSPQVRSVTDGRYEQAAARRETVARDKATFRDADVAPRPTSSQNLGGTPPPPPPPPPGGGEGRRGRTRVADGEGQGTTEAGLTLAPQMTSTTRSPAAGR